MKRQIVLILAALILGLSACTEGGAGAPGTGDVPCMGQFPAEYGKGDPGAEEVPPFSGAFDPASYGAFLSAALGRDIALRGQIPFSQVFLYLPAIAPAEGEWTVYFVRPEGEHVRDLVPTPRTLALPEDIPFTDAAPALLLPSAGTGEVEIVVALTTREGTVYVSWDNFDWTDESDALALTYRGPLPDERVKELREEGLIP